MYVMNVGVLQYLTYAFIRSKIFFVRELHKTLFVMWCLVEQTGLQRGFVQLGFRCTREINAKRYTVPLFYALVVSLKKWM